MSMILYLTIVYIIIVVILGFWTISMIDKHRTNLEAIQKDTRTLIEDIRAIAEHIEETNRLLDDMEIRMLERLDNIGEIERRQ